jgi:hypothetical protein
MRRAVELVAVVLLPSAVGFAVIAAGRLARWLGRRVADRGHAPAGPPIERLAADARRLRAALTEAEAAEPGPGRGVRLRALRAAYAETLVAACRALEVSPPPPADSAPAAGAVMGPAEIYRMEAALRRHGFDVRNGASHGPPVR